MEASIVETAPITLVRTWPEGNTWPHGKLRNIAFILGTVFPSEKLDGLSLSVIMMQGNLTHTD